MFFINIKPSGRKANQEEAKYICKWEVKETDLEKLEAKINLYIQKEKREGQVDDKDKLICRRGKQWGEEEYWGE